jgi:ribosomal protein S18 acetylase RimI-like enzyme
MRIFRLKSGDERLWSEAVAAVILEEDRDGQLASERELSRTLADLRCYLFIAMENSEPVGLLSAYRFPNVVAGGEIVYLYDIEVRVEHRRKGIGSALVRSLVACCESEQVRLIWAGTDVSNVAARRTFEVTGAELAGKSYAEYEWDLEG